MSSSAKRTSRPGRQSLFFHDLASPVSTQRGKFTSPGQAAAVSALWRENFGVADLPPPPPIFTLDDRAEFSPESGIPEYPMSPESKSEIRTTPVRDSFSPLKSRSEASTSHMQHFPGSSSWWSPAKGSSDRDEKGKGSPVDGVVHSGALITLPPPREVARPELQRNSLPESNLDEEEWVTVYGFSLGDTNIVLREFEKCGVILKHFPGPRDANWMHILYQSRSDAQKALRKNGMQINGILIVGVKSLDPIERQSLNERLNKQGFMTWPSPSSRSTELTPSRASPRPYYLQNNNNSSAQRSAGAIALPAKSVLTKMMDLMFGI